MVRLRLGLRKFLVMGPHLPCGSIAIVGMSAIFALMSFSMDCSTGSPLWNSESGRLLERMSFICSTIWRCLVAAERKELAFSEE